ncbi:DUF4148 domain-containing protein [Roseateles sp. DAIF2]|uniref:DUF4148 domain-containing protein n=1 Tax=Roseateles sp. DAIF2 TaxID=2714952 RepID=UPI0018A31250|nr:DUF4148 domain-containing protein [Roseateles sp. DAIF2]QPF72707.1 DUF4148 domain-containing protein [Roseateles sp. DAIF2]
MIKKLSVIALSLIAAGAAMAQGLTREQVVAELERARASGELAVLNSENPSAFERGQFQAKSNTTRAAVLAELERARSAGEIARVDYEAYGPVFAKQGVSTKTRAEVVAELERARANGELAVLNSNNPSYAELAGINQGAQAQRLAGQPKSAQ